MSSNCSASVCSIKDPGSFPGSWCWYVLMEKGWHTSLGWSWNISLQCDVIKFWFSGCASPVGHKRSPLGLACTPQHIWFLIGVPSNWWCLFKDVVVAQFCRIVNMLLERTCHEPAALLPRNRTKPLVPGARCTSGIASRLHVHQNLLHIAEPRTCHWSSGASSCLAVSALHNRIVTRILRVGQDTPISRGYQ